MEESKFHTTCPECGEGFIEIGPTHVGQMRPQKPDSSVNRVKLTGDGIP